MAKGEKGFFDQLVEDICNTIEIKGAVEATRDENGKVDKWAATGLAMGLGHTSDYEMATLAGFLGAEGAFDDLSSLENNSVEETVTENDAFSETDEEAEDFEDTFIGTILVYADDMRLLSEAGYDEFELELMEPSELEEAMEDAGVDTFLYDFD